MFFVLAAIPKKNFMIRSIFFFCICSFAVLFSVNSFSQQKDSTFAKKDSAVIKISGYVDSYYAYFTDSVGDSNFQKFPSVSPRSNQFGLNTAMLTAQYDAEKIRGIISLQFGDIARSTWSSSFNNIMEAHAGIRLCKTLWLDVGFFRSHLGTEGLLPKENLTSSVSVGTYYSPYYENGFRLNYNPNDKLAINLYTLNGYNIYEDNNNRKSFGMLTTYTLKNKGNIGYSNYIGDDTPSAADSIPHFRVHQNLFWNYQIKKIKIQIGGDYCMQQNSDTSGKKSASVFSGVATCKYLCIKKVAVYARGEIFNDPQGFMSAPPFRDLTGKLTGLKLWGVTAGMEYQPNENSYIRLEGRQIYMDDAQKIFRWKENKNFRLEILFNVGISF